MGKASSLFHSDREHTLHKRVTPTQEQRDFLQGQWNELAEYLKDSLYRKYGYKNFYLAAGLIQICHANSTY